MRFVPLPKLIQLINTRQTIEIIIGLAHARSIFWHQLKVLNGRKSFIRMWTCCYYNTHGLRHHKSHTTYTQTKYNHFTSLFEVYFRRIICRLLFFCCITKNFLLPKWFENWIFQLMKQVVNALKFPKFTKNWLTDFYFLYQTKNVRKYK